ncbi:hypothetical protein CBR_g45609 [Chara braunii]|uniref:E3 ubiquitin-protein ligase CHIP n=1 Tax=Chara braunii TaxID=69332 RepID=A0A388LZ55_CHABU|nr:hypothetical protein CBR_g45609 [Chara braunii]|eukprot:GBG87551.1 hypothetical protein CBR_g45609 [Chara braunii]
MIGNSQGCTLWLGLLDNSTTMTEGSLASRSSSSPRHLEEGEYFVERRSPLVFIMLNAAKQAEALKNQGNEYYMKQKFGAAIDMYTEAIALCPKVPVYWTNRAACHRKRNEWVEVEEDCRTALQLDKESVKAHFMLGLALLRRKESARGVCELEKALDLARGGSNGIGMAEEIWQELSKVRFTLWKAEGEERGQRVRDLHLQCERLLKEDSDRACHMVSSSGGRVPNLSSGSSPVHGGVFRNGFSQWLGIGKGMAEVDSCGDPDCQAGIPTGQESGSKDEHNVEKLRRIKEETNARLALLKDVFSVAEQRDCPGEVPDHLCCKLTMEIFRDPVITPSGITYERASLLEHLRKVGKFDPVTRATLHAEQLVPNLALKESVQLYLADHGWAYKL